MGVNKDEKHLIPLMELGKYMPKSRAAIIYDSGITTIKDLARSHPNHIHDLLCRAQPFQRKMVYFSCQHNIHFVLFVAVV